MLQLHFFKHISVEIDRVVVIPAIHLREAADLLEEYVGSPKEYMPIEFASIVTAKEFVMIGNGWRDSYGMMMVERKVV